MAKQEEVDEPVVGDRPFTSALGSDALEQIYRGTLLTTYRGRRFIKNPFDLVLYMNLIERLQPRTVIEVGTLDGGSALWFADTLRNHAIEGRVISIDVSEPPDLEDDRITFLHGDATKLEEVLDSAGLQELPHPFLVVEDTAHLFETSLAVLEFFHPHLERGDYVVIEDGVVDSLPGEAFERYENGPNRAVASFLASNPTAYEIDHGICDRYGYNVTFCPNGWLRRVS